jgi:hypothetical protein
MFGSARSIPAGSAVDARSRIGVTGRTTTLAQSALLLQNSFALKLLLFFGLFILVLTHRPDALLNAQL